MKSNLIVFLAIHLVTPIIGVIFYLNLIQKLKREKIEDPPVTELFLAFATYGGLLRKTSKKALALGAQSQGMNLTLF